MDEFLVENNSFEIIAILRDLHLKNIELIIISENNPVYISAVDHAGFEITRPPALTLPEGIIRFTVKSNDMMLYFFARFSKKNTTSIVVIFHFQTE